MFALNGRRSGSPEGAAGRFQFIIRKVETELPSEPAAKGVTLLMRRFVGSNLGGGFVQTGKSKPKIYIKEPCP